MKGETKREDSQQVMRELGGKERSWKKLLGGEGRQGRERAGRLRALSLRVACRVSSLGEESLCDRVGPTGTVCAERKVGN